MTNAFLGDPSATHPQEFGRIYPPDEVWLGRQHVEEVLLPDLPIVDPHHHLWDLPNNRYLATELDADLSSGHNVVATVYCECTLKYRADGPPLLRPVGETEFVRAEVAGPTRSRGMAAGIIGYADLSAGAAVEDVLIEHLAAGDGSFKGVRYATNWDPHASIISSHEGGRQHLLLEPAVLQGLEKVQALDLTFDAWLFFPQLADIEAVADAMPGLNIVLDHCGGPLGYGPYAHDKAENFRLWSAALRRVAERPNVTCKLGGVLGRGAAYDYITAETPPTSQELARAWGPWFETCMEAFGPQRCMFESNFPVEKMGTGYATLWNAFKRISMSASDDERRQLFAGTAERTYGLTPRA